MKKVFLRFFVASLVVMGTFGIFTLSVGKLGIFEFKVLITTLAFIVYSLTGLCCSTIDSSRYFFLSKWGVRAAIFGLAYAAITTWVVPERFDLVLRGRLAFLIISVAFAHAALLVRISTTNKPAILSRTVAILAGGITSILLVSMIIGVGFSSIKMVGIIAIIGAVSTITTPIMHFISKANNSNSIATDFSKVTSKHSKSIVKVSSNGTEGTGLIVSKAGYVITCLHLVKDADRIIVTLENGETFIANKVEADPKIDISIVKLGGVESPVTVADLGSSSKLGVGEGLLAGGCQENAGLLFSGGVVIAKGPNFIKIDTAAPFGCDGCPLFDKDGKVVGVIGAVINEGGKRNLVAIPIDLIKPVIEKAIGVKP